MSQNTQTNVAKPAKGLSPEIAEFLHMLSSLESRQPVAAAATKSL